MKKIIYSLIILLSLSNLVVAQENHHGIKVDGAISSLSGAGDYGTELGTVTLPGISYSLLRLGTNWGFIYEFGYNQSGLKETYPNGTFSTIKTHNINCSTVGVQYSFLDDWAKLRPIMQARLGFDICVAGSLNYQNESQDIDFQVVSVPWNIAAGFMYNKHVVGTIGFGRDFIKYLDVTDGKNQKIKLSLTYYF